MGRWGEHIYGSDKALDYHLTITNLLERELAYWLSPAQVDNSDRWLAEVFAVIEVILLLEQHNSLISSAILEGKTVQQWRETIMGVWDAEWRDKGKAFKTTTYTAEYRKQHRPAVTQIFDHFHSIAHRFASLPDDLPLTPLLPDYQPPYFSKVGSRFTNDLIEHLVKDIIYFLSPEKRWESILLDVEGVWVAVDLLGFLCEVYEHSPEVNQPFVSKWRDATIEIDRLFAEDETSSLYPDVLRAFDRLEAVALKYPAIEW